jgi:hypothetical protein
MNIQGSTEETREAAERVATCVMQEASEQNRKLEIKSPDDEHHYAAFKGSPRTYTTTLVAKKNNGKTFIYQLELSDLDCQKILNLPEIQDFLARWCPEQKQNGGFGHITVLYIGYRKIPKEKKKLVKILSTCVGLKCDIELLGVGCDDRVAAIHVRVSDPNTNKLLTEHLHITLSLNPNANPKALPFESNGMLKQLELRGMLG